MALICRVCDKDAAGHNLNVVSCNAKGKDNQKISPTKSKHNLLIIKYTLFMFIKHILLNMVYNVNCKSLLTPSKACRLFFRRCILNNCLYTCVRSPSGMCSISMQPVCKEMVKI